MRASAFFLICVLSVFFAQRGLCASEFKWSASSEGAGLVVSVEIPAKKYLYADSVQVVVKDAAGKRLNAVSSPAPEEKLDPVLEKKISIYGGGRTHQWKFEAPPGGKFSSCEVRYQGCGEEPFVCYAPKKVELSLSGGGAAVLGLASGAVSDILPGFALRKTLAGTAPAEEFLKFLDLSSQDYSARPGKGRSFLLEWIEAKGWFLKLLAAALGGLLLNLTPCVLPMIPVNLAIIGAGDAASSKARGFLLGGVYGLGIALSYGLLGVVSVVTGATFGALNSSAAFNISVGVVFFVLALAMFDVLSIDFSKYGAKVGTGRLGRWRLGAAFVLGGVSAALAGACVAPVVIAVLLYAASSHASGDWFGLLLPLFLGMGMALPWPFAGAGLAVMPKPGKWMVRVRQVFGVAILLLSVWYIVMGANLVKLRNWSAEREAADLAAAAERARASGRPLLVDFWASWCKNCVAMEKTTLKNPEVARRMASFEVLKFQAEKPDSPKVKKILDALGVRGVPTYMILTPDGRGN